VSKELEIEPIPGGGISSARGFFAGATYAGIKKKGKDVVDLALLFSEARADAAAVFTRNKVKAAPVVLDREKLRRDPAVRAVVANAGCANACTGVQGLRNAQAVCSLIAKNLGLEEKEVLTASTGVIGVQLPMDKIQDSVARIALSKDGGSDFTHAIMTTDTRAKEIALRLKAPGFDIVVGGTAKGAGMIHPDMATMLCFIATDAAVDPGFLQSALKRAVDASFNLISVDGDTSTNDTVLVLANGAAGNSRIDRKSDLAKGFQAALDQVCLSLAQEVARDGEGATRLIEVQVRGAGSLKDARLAARTIASSPLVKTAVHGCDPNWGRIVAAAGRSGAEMDEAKTDVYIGDICLLKAGTPQTFERQAAARALDQERVILRLDLNLGRSAASAWGCDLSEEYVVINSEYTT
jgi:glutamate N-acetyltransferase/amino-acid N-acetyltransferase